MATPCPLRMTSLSGMRMSGGRFATRVDSEKSRAAKAMGERNVNLVSGGVCAAKLLALEVHCATAYDGAIRDRVALFIWRRRCCLEMKIRFVLN